MIYKNKNNFLKKKMNETLQISKGEGVWKEAANLKRAQCNGATYSNI